MLHLIAILAGTAVGPALVILLKGMGGRDEKALGRVRDGAPGAEAGTAPKVPVSV